SLTVPSAPWNLILPGSDLHLEHQELQPDGKRGYFVITGAPHDLNVSVFIEPAAQCTDSKSCRDFVWKTGNPMWGTPQNVVLSEIGDVSILELLVSKFGGQELRQHNLYAEYVVDGYWVDLHLSKVLYRPEEHQFFEDFVKSIRFGKKGEEKPRGR